MSYTSRVIADFVLNFVAMATWIDLFKICLISLDSPTPKTPCWMQRSPRYIVYKPTCSRFCPKFHCHGSGLVTVELFWLHSITRPRKLRAICKDLRDICHMGIVIANFVPNFVAMATGVGCSRICLASFNSPTPKTPSYMQRSHGYLVYNLYTRYRLIL